jgi:hypothetical protein
MIVGYVKSSKPSIWCHVVFEDGLMALDRSERRAILLEAEARAKREIPLPECAGEWPLVGLMTEADAKRLGEKVEPWPTYSAR